MLTAVFAIAAMASSAQVYLGGEVGLWRNWEANKTDFKLAPEVGYNLSEKWAIGLEFAYEHNYNSGVAVNGVGIAPYGRFTYAKLGPVKLFLDGGFGFATYKIKDADDSFNAWEVGIKPGLSVTLTKNLSFITHVGFLGYRDADDELSDAVNTGFGFDVSGSSLTFGLYYNF